MPYPVSLCPRLYFPKASQQPVLKAFSEEWNRLASKKGYTYSACYRGDSYSKGIDIYVGVPNVSGAFIYAQYSLLTESASDQNTVCLNGKYAKDGKPLGYLAWRGISEICAKYDGTEMVEVAWCKFAPNPKFLDELKREINPVVRKQFESCDGKMKRLLAKQG